jgi:hypothetical protein
MWGRIELVELTDGTASLDGKGLFISFVAGSLIFIVISIEKWILRELLNKKEKEN